MPSKYNSKCGQRGQLLEWKPAAEVSDGTRIAATALLGCADDGVGGCEDDAALGRRTAACCCPTAVNMLPSTAGASAAAAAPAGAAEAIEELECCLPGAVVAIEQPLG